MARLIGAQQLHRRLSALEGGFGVSIPRTLGLATVREARLLVHRRTGNLGRSITILSQTEKSVVVGSTVRYAPYVELGTGPHEITPRAAKALRWAASPAGRRLSGAPRVGAAVVFAKRVHHPGTKPYPFLVPGARLAVQKAGLKDIVIARWNEAA